MSTTPVLSRPEQVSELLGVPFTGEQLAAIGAPLEPGVIVAGAGSGKTEVMGARVVWLVGTGQVLPGQVLGLTFTNKAAGELLARVRAALRSAGLLPDPLQLPPAAPVAAGPAGAGDGPGAAAEEPTILTYHAYARRLLVEHGLRLGVEPQARLLADAARYQLAARTLRRTRVPLTASSHGFATLVDDLLALEGELSEHLCTTDELREHDAAVIAEVAAEAKPTKPMQEIAAAARARIELSRVVDEYRAAKSQLDLVDFGDQMSLGARLAEQCPEVSELERDVYRVVLLDEYQDTSVAQRRMLSGLYPGGHPVTAVGDPCQAIYGWRGASVANIDQFPAHFPRRDGSPAPVYRLTRNLRSGGRILDLANDVAGPLRALHPQVAPLVAQPGRETEGALRCALLPTYADELAWVGDRVAGLIAGGVDPAQIAVLCRASGDFVPLRDALHERGVPVEVVGLGGLLAAPEVADVVATLEVLADPTANPALVRLLTGPRFRIGPRDLALLGRRAADLVRLPAGPDPVEPLRSAVEGIDPVEVVALADALDSPGGLPYSSEARERFARLAAELRQLRRLGAESVADLVTAIVVTTGLDVEVALAARVDPAARGRENLAAFIDLAARFADLDGASSLLAFLAYLRTADERDVTLDAAPPSDERAVKLLTAHKAKGLQWEAVVVPMLSAGVFPSDQGRGRWTTNPKVLPYPLRGDAASLPPLGALTSAALKEFAGQCRDHALVEEQRLGYVAFTRPKRILLASGHWWGPRQKNPRGPSPFLAAVQRACAAGHGQVDAWAPPPADGESNPVFDQVEAHPWPVPADPTAADARRRAADAVLQAAAGPDVPEPAEAGGLSPHETALVAGWDSDLSRLLDELHDTHRTEREVELPAALTASQLLALDRDPDGFARALLRPMPRPPAPSARRGTRFHAWVEARFGQQPLLEPDDLPGAADADAADVVSETDLADLQRAFLATGYADDQPYAVEAPFQILLAGRVVRGRIDAVYRRGDGWEVVDWKTNRSADADPLQLAIYRLAWAELQGVPLARVDATFLYIRTGRAVRPPALPGRAELEALLTGSQASSTTSGR